MHLSGTTTMLGLVGTPVEHSKSPAMYNHCFAKYELDWAYLAFNVPQEQAGAAVQAIRTLNMRGANVTMPCKSAVIPYLDRLSPEAQAIGAVNVIVNDGGVLTGYNTDGMGYTQNLRRGGVEVTGKKIVLLGGGGAASAIAGPVWSRRCKTSPRPRRRAPSPSTIWTTGATFIRPSAAATFSPTPRG